MYALPRGSSRISRFQRFWKWFFFCPESFFLCLLIIIDSFSTLRKLAVGQCPLVTGFFFRRETFPIQSPYMIRDQTSHCCCDYRWKFVRTLVTRSFSSYKSKIEIETHRFPRSCRNDSSQFFFKDLYSETYGHITLFLLLQNRFFVILNPYASVHGERIAKHLQFRKSPLSKMF